MTRVGNFHDFICSFKMDSENTILKKVFIETCYFNYL